MADKRSGAKPIAIIGWGSLIWDLENLSPHVVGEWTLGAGPTLPLEFTRASPKRKMALTVVVDREHGEPCATALISSRRTSVAEAAADLAARERVPLHRIGWVDSHADEALSRDPEYSAVISVWCNQAGFAGAVWTDLPGNFIETARQPFSIPAGISYLQGLTGEALVEAKTYIDSAPSQTWTPLRAALADDPWWRSVAR